MPTKNLIQKEQTGEALKNTSNVSRRNFLGYLGGASALLVAGTACQKDSVARPSNPTDGIDLGSGDVGILNYAYALEQLEAAFYKKVTDAPFTGITPVETGLLTSIRDHEIGHREFFKAALGTSALPDLEFDFSSINFSDRTVVFSTAKAFEDLGVSAYNGAGKLIVSPDYLILAGKIVSVEARHAGIVRDCLVDGTFADDLDVNALDISRTPAEVFAIAGKYIKTKLNISNLPTN